MSLEVGQSRRKMVSQTGVHLRDTDTHGQVLFLDPVLCEQLRDVAGSQLRPRQQQHPGGRLVQPVQRLQLSDWGVRRAKGEGREGWSSWARWNLQPSWRNSSSLALSMLWCTGWFCFGMRDEILH